MRETRMSRLNSVSAVAMCPVRTPAMRAAYASVPMRWMTKAQPANDGKIRVHWVEKEGRQGYFIITPRLPLTPHQQIQAIATCRAQEKGSRDAIVQTDEFQTSTGPGGNLGANGSSIPAKATAGTPRLALKSNNRSPTGCRRKFAHGMG